MVKSTLQKASIKMLKNNVGLKKGERIVVVTDRKNCSIFKAVCISVNIMEGHLTEVYIDKKRNSSAPLKHLKKTFIESEIIIGITDKSISHCPETRIARKKYGTRVISMPGIDEKLFLKTIRIDQEKIKNIGDKIAKKLRKTQQVKITTPSGTDVKVKVIKDAVMAEHGDATKKGNLTNLPYGEVTMAPINIAEGTIAIDSASTGIKPKDNVKVFIKKGKIVGYNNKKAKAFFDYLKKIDENNALRFVELAFGTNAKHKRLIGKNIHDEKIIGSAHIAFGGLGDKRKCKIHQDVILLKPTVFFDKKLVIESGKIL